MHKETSMPNRSETFARLLKGAINSIAAYEGKTTLVVEKDLGERIGVSGATIQRWKSGILPSEDRTIAILAEAAVRRGYLGREWLQRFLHAARYPFAATLLDRLCPSGPVHPRPLRIYHNLPAPTYSQFVMRAEAFAEVREGLSKQSALVLIVGLGGNGKTSLAREVAAQCLKDNGNSPRFDAVIWVSDKDRPGTTNLSIVLDEIARTLDYPGFTQFDHDEKRREIENLLRRQRVLIVADNFETITDSALLAWLQTLSEPSKALITAREYRREYRRGGWLVELRGMTDHEARTLIAERLRVLKIEKLVSDQTQLEPLVVTTGGNPKAIEIALGIVKHERRPLQQVVDDFYAARGELFADLFTRAWALLDEAARRVLLSMSFFPDSASGDALSATADVQGFAFDRSVERLADLALLDVQQIDLTSTPRYALHPLVRAFAGAKLVELSDFEVGARERWVHWYIQLVSKVGFCWDDLSKLEWLDPEQDTLQAVIQWCFQKRHYPETIKLVNDAHYYYYVRCLWSEQPSIYLLAAESANIQNDLAEEVFHLSRYLEVLSIQGKNTEAEVLFKRLDFIASSTELPIGCVYMCYRASALYWMSRRDFVKAQSIWEKSIEVASKEDHVPFGNWRAEQGLISANNFLASCWYHLGLLSEAQHLFKKTLSNAELYHYRRAITFSHLYLAMIEIDQGDVDSAEEYLVNDRTYAYKHRDRRSLALIQRTYARLHMLRNDFDAACAALTEAIDLFERLGMRRELAEAREALADLETRECMEAAG
jgi:tetratricopeptide (TPR) repeat protein